MDNHDEQLRTAMIAAAIALEIWSRTLKATAPDMGPTLSNAASVAMGLVADDLRRAASVGPDA